MGRGSGVLIDRLVEQTSPPEALLVPVVRAAIARRVRASARASEGHGDPVAAFAAARSRGPIAVHADSANDQHYEVPAEFFELALGPRLKYSSALYACTREGDPGTTDLATAEEAMLDLTCRRAGLEDGMAVLDLGCGWGSLSLWIAERYPNCRVTGLSNSAPQRRSIQGRAAARDLDLEIITANVAELDLGERRFDRAISIEMFEHVRNHAALLERIAACLDPAGALFVHVFAHARNGYEFEDSWMTRRFFRGGVMPVHGWLGELQSPLELAESWWLNGSHYARTADAWLENFERNLGPVQVVFEPAYGVAGAKRAIRAWRLFFIATREIFAYGRGEAYGVSHALLRPR